MVGRRPREQGTAVRGAAADPWHARAVVRSRLTGQTANVNWWIRHAQWRTKAGRRGPEPYNAGLKSGPRPGPEKHLPRHVARGIVPAGILCSPTSEPFHYTFLDPP